MDLQTTTIELDASRLAALLSPSDIALLHKLNEISAVIVRLKDGLDESVAAVCAKPAAVNSDESMTAAAEDIKAARDVCDKIRDQHAGVKDFAHKLHKVICTQEAGLIQQCETWIKTASRNIALYVESEKKRRFAEQQEQQRLLDKQHDKAVEKHARQLEKSGDGMAAAQVREQGQYQRPAAYVPPVAPPSGTSVKQGYDFEISDSEAVPRAWCQPDEKKIRRHVNNLGKDAIGSIPGVRVFPKDATATVRR